MIDMVGAAVLLLVFAPLMIGVAVLVWLVHGRPVLFCDDRAGLNGEQISVTKFRSMRSPAEKSEGACNDEDRLTRLGKFLRRTSLDELPQLFSVIQGDMSLVGPRPLPMRYVSRYTPRQAKRLRVRPGLTGWAQIHGRNSLDWPERLEYDAQYVEMAGRWWAPLLDLWIIAATVVQVVWQAVTGRGVSAPGYATMQEFTP
jgi:lipopolysaccharide/colanic/teichoic acid biosynthesis glycosyltransferase